MDAFNETNLINIKNEKRKDLLRSNRKFLFIKIIYIDIYGGGGGGMGKKVEWWKYKYEGILDQQYSDMKWITNDSEAQYFQIISYHKIIIV